MAVAQADPTAISAAQAREDWLTARMVEFAADPAQRDRALAIILWDSLNLNQMMNELATQVKQGGVGGLIKGLMGK